jgi:hypothetical protein
MTSQLLLHLLLLLLLTTAITTTSTTSTACTITATTSRIIIINNILLGHIKAQKEECSSITSIGSIIISSCNGTKCIQRPRDFQVIIIPTEQQQ